MSSAHRTAVEPMNMAERLFGKFMNWTVLVKKTTTVSNRGCFACRLPKPGTMPQATLLMNQKTPQFSGDTMSPLCHYRPRFCLNRVLINVTSCQKNEYFLTIISDFRIQSPDKRSRASALAQEICVGNLAVFCSGPMSTRQAQVEPFG